MLSMLELSVLILSDRGLHLVQSLLHKHTILHVQDTVSVALDVRVMRNHHTSGRCVLSLSLRANPVNVQDQVHNRNYKKVISNLGIIYLLSVNQDHQ